MQTHGDNALFRCIVASEQCVRVTLGPSSTDRIRERLCLQRDALFSHRQLSPLSRNKICVGNIQPVIYVSCEPREAVCLCRWNFQSSILLDSILIFVSDRIEMHKQAREFESTERERSELTVCSTERKMFRKESCLRMNECSSQQ